MLYIPKLFSFRHPNSFKCNLTVFTRLRKSGHPRRPRKHPVLSNGPTSVRDIAEDPSLPWETVALAEGTKGPIITERKFLRCFSCRADGNRNYVKPGDEIWLYLRKYAGDEIKYFVSNAPRGSPGRGTGQGSNVKVADRTMLRGMQEQSGNGRL